MQSFCRYVPTWSSRPYRRPPEWALYHTWKASGGWRLFAQTGTYQQYWACSICAWQPLYLSRLYCHCSSAGCPRQARSRTKTTENQGASHRFEHEDLNLRVWALMIDIAENQLSCNNLSSST